MLVWLGKQMLGQKDKQEQEITAKYEIENRQVLTIEAVQRLELDGMDVGRLQELKGLLSEAIEKSPATETVVDVDET
jgi:hypothetical protein